MGDTSSSTLLTAFPQIAQQFPNNIACIFIRNTSITDSGDKLPYDTSEFKNVKNDSYFFYRTAEGVFSLPSECACALMTMSLDLVGLDIVNGQCKNNSVPQNVSFASREASSGITAWAPSVLPIS